MAFNSNVAGLLRNVLQWILHTLLSVFTSWVKRVFISLMYAIVVMIAISVVLFFAVRLATGKGDSSPMSPGNEITVTVKEWWKYDNVIKILKDALLYAATLLPSDEPLTIGNLLWHRDRLGGLNHVLQACFNVAIDVFNQEPHSVQQNARMVIQCDGQAIKFLSGSGDCEISIYLLYGKIQHCIRVLTAEMYLARLSVRKEPLSVGDLLRVRSKLQSWKVLSQELGGCLEFAVQEFDKEPFCVQDDARMVVDCGGQVLRFLSGSGANDISVYDVQGGGIHYRIRISGLWASTARFFQGIKDHSHTQPKKPLQLE